MEKKQLTDGSMALQEKQCRVITIEATEKQQDIKLRVAAYARVSSASDDQLNSFAAQNRYYADLISGKENWSMVDIYADEGITGTSAEKREDFQRLLADCHRGLIDRILVKSISRFARNTTECLETIRELKALGISIYFEKENIDTSTMSGEMMTAIFAAFAQAESESISGNMRWSYQKRVTTHITEAQKILRRLSGWTETKQIEQQVLGLLNMLLNNPERIQVVSPHPKSENVELQRQLDAVLSCQPIDEDAAQELIRSIASVQYSAIDADEYESIRLRRILAQHPVRRELDAKLLKTTVSAIRVYSDKSIAIRLKNNQIIGRSEPQ